MAAHPGVALQHPSLSLSARHGERSGHAIPRLARDRAQVLIGAGLARGEGERAGAHAPNPSPERTVATVHATTDQVRPVLRSGWSMSTGGRSCTSCLAIVSRMLPTVLATAPIGMATSLRPHRSVSYTHLTLPTIHSV